MAEEIDDRAFHELLRSIQPNIQELGSVLWVKDRWKAGKPPLKYRLPIDDVIDQLLARKARPRIDLAKFSSRPINAEGPYRAARELLFFTLQKMSRDPVAEEQRLEFLKSFLNKLKAAEESLSEVAEIFWDDPSKIARRTLYSQREIDLGKLESTDFSQVPKIDFGNMPFYSECWSKLMKCGYNIDRARKALLELAETTVAEAAATKAIKTVGAPTVLWKRDFISSISALWHRLTGEKPARTEDSHFGTFVYGAWNSLGDDMPEVSFARAILDNQSRT